MQATIGVLALQGDFAEHIATFKRCNTKVECREVRKKEQLEGLHGLVIPGGESTVMLKLLKDFEMFDAVRDFGVSGMPCFGTCAGCIMMSKSIDVDKAMAQSIQPNQSTLQLADYTVTRNAYGAQTHSFETELEGDTAVFGKTPCRAVLIRAPMITSAGEGTQSLLAHTHPERGSTPVLLRQGNVLACTFHPEITGDARIHEYFLSYIVTPHNKSYTLSK
jgi:5'-phosphate synthase pdxT subunit